MSHLESQPYLRIHHLTYLNIHLGHLHLQQIDPARIHLDRKKALQFAHERAAAKIGEFELSYSQPVSNDSFWEEFIIKRPYTLDLLGPDLIGKDQYLAELRRFLFLWLTIDPAAEVSLGFEPDMLCYACQSTHPDKTGAHCEAPATGADGDEQVLAILKLLSGQYPGISIHENSNVAATLPGSLIKNRDFISEIHGRYYDLSS